MFAWTGRQAALCCVLFFLAVGKYLDGCNKSFKIPVWHNMIYYKVSETYFENLLSIIQLGCELKVPWFGSCALISSLYNVYTYSISTTDTQ